SSERDWDVKWDPRSARNMPLGRSRVARAHDFGSLRMTIEAYFDGLCEPNPGGVATYGFIIKRDGKKAYEGHGLAGTPKTPQATNNVAEYTGLIKALECLLAQKVRGPIVVRGDSDLILKQVQGLYKVKSALLAPLHGQ